MNKKIVIVSGGELNEKFTLSVLREEAGCVIGVDRGMEFLYHHQIMPSYIVGDFDSVDQTIATYYRDETDVPIREFNPVKDASDTEIAIRLAMTLGCKKMIILGATGGRIDHLLGKYTVACNSISGRCGGADPRSAESYPADRRRYCD